MTRTKCGEHLGQSGESVPDPWEVAKVEPLAPPVLLRWWRWLRGRPAGVLVMGGRLSELVRSSFSQGALEDLPSSLFAPFSCPSWLQSGMDMVWIALQSWGCSSHTLPYS